jgi:hypothetical protein
MEDFGGEAEGNMLSGGQRLRGRITLRWDLEKYNGVV